MHVLVTGGAGYIGVTLCEQLLEEGHDVTVLDRFYFGFPNEPGSLLSKVRLIRGDIRRLDDAWLDGIDAVMHLGGLSNDPTAEYNPEANWQMNTVATQELVAACKRRGIARLTFASSASIYDCETSAHTLDKSPIMCEEDSAVTPRGAYSVSKKAAEDAILEAVSDDFHPVIFRQGTVHGYSQRMRFDLVVNTFLKDAIVNHTLYLHGGGWMWRPLVDVRDVARAHVMALSAPLEKISGQIFNVHEENYQIRQLAMLVSGSLSMLPDPIHVRMVTADLPKVVRNYRMSNAKLSNALGFTPSISVLESIEDMLARLPIARKDFLLDPRWYNIRWMTMLQEIHEMQAQYDSIY